MNNAKVVQIMAAPWGEESDLYALDSEGNMWRYFVGTSKKHDAHSPIEYIPAFWKMEIPHEHKRVLELPHERNER